MIKKVSKRKVKSRITKRKVRKNCIAGNRKVNPKLRIKRRILDTARGV